MKSNISRRQFVKQSSWGAAACLTLPAFLQNTFLSLDARASTLPSPGGEGPITIIIEMGGGNDSLNTVIPFQNEIYIGARPTIALREEHGLLSLGQTNNILGATEQLALHPSMGHLHQLWQEGQLAIVNGVGYPNPNLSHFTSFDYMHTAMPNTNAVDGWVGRYFDSQCSGCDATQAIELARTQTRAFASSGGISPSVTFTDPESYGWKALETRGRDVPLEQLYRELIGLDHIVDDGIDLRNDALSYVQRSTHNAMISARTVHEANENGAELLVEEWPNTGLSRDLQRIARLIKGGMDTSIYYAHQNGYDTHGDQASGSNPTTGRHSDLLGNFDSSLGALIQELKLAGVWDRVVIMTISEFGRKVIENGSSGTDHGAAESIFVMGGGVQGGQFYGHFPDLAEDARVKRHSLDYNVDFRTVYRSILQNWMGVPPESMADIFPLQPDNFSPLSFV